MEYTLESSKQHRHQQHEEQYHHQQTAQRHQDLLIDQDSTITADEVIDRIEDVMASIFELMEKDELPTILKDDGSSSSTRRGMTSSSKSFRLAHCRSFTSVLLVLSYCHFLLREHRTTTTREVYYFFVLHFRNQRECEEAIWEAAIILKVPRVNLGLSASSKGWYCGSLQIVRTTTTATENHISNSSGGLCTTTVTDTQNLTSVEGQPITREWLDWKRNGGNDFDIQTNATCIIVVEKEGIYKRLCEDRFFDRLPCIIVTGKGVPDLATRAFVHTMHTSFGRRLPVYCLCDCNPYGVGVLWTYCQGSKRIGVDGGDRYSVPIQWLGLRPSQVEKLRKEDKMPDTNNVFQDLTDHDRKKLESLSHASHPFHAGVTNSSARLEELKRMKKYKVELEALQWMGMDYICDWLYNVIQRHHAGEQGLII